MATTLADPATHAASLLLDTLFQDLPTRDFAIHLWDGTTWPRELAGPPRFVMSIHEPAALRRLVLARDEAALGEGYMSGGFDLEGDLEAIPAVAEALLASPPRWRARLRLLAAALRLPREPGVGPGPSAGAVPAGGDGSRTGPYSARRAREIGRAAAASEGSGSPGAASASGTAAEPRLSGRLHSPARDRQAVTYHYDASNAFYELFLDPLMVYSCAYFESREEPLARAQERKLDYICRKLRLRPGERLLDIGCGWGALILHAAREYGVIADGITLSRNQAELARERIRAAGLEDRCTVRIQDYRELGDVGAYDKMASIGMFEHVGLSAMDEYFRQAFRLLRPGGVFLNHAIGAIQGDQPHGQSFSDRWVFPDSEPLPINVTLRGAEEAGFDVRDVENLREHYALTLRHWLRSLEARRADALRAAPETIWRAWRLVFASAAHNFDAGRSHLYQALLVKPGPGGTAGVPLTRGDWYAA